MSGRDRPRVFRLQVGRAHVEHDVDAELAFHLAMRERKLAARGLSPEEARREALRQFGDLSAVRGECLTIDRERERAMRRAIHFDDLRRDAAFAVRSLSARKGFTTILLLILALGIGANAATFTLVDALLLRTLPVPHAEQLVTVGQPWRTGNVSRGTPSTAIYSYPLYADLRDDNRVLTGLYASGRANRLDILLSRDSAGQARTGGEPEHPRGRFVSGNYFAVLGVPAFLGRTFTGAEDRVPAGDPYVVISHGYWLRRFGGSRTAIGSALTINGAPMTIVGVAPPGFTGDIVGANIDLWIPLMMQPALMPHDPWLEDRNTSWLLLMGRRAPGVTVEQARSALGALAKRSLLAHATGNDVAALENSLREVGIPVDDGARGFSGYRRTYAAALYTLSAAVALVLLVICANVANLLLARATARGREITVRMAIGAGRVRVVQQLLVESVVLAAAGGVLGTIVAAWGSRALLRLASNGPAPIPLDTSLNVRVLGFTAAVAFVTALLFGLAPALHATRMQLAAVLRSSGRGLTTGGRGAGRLPLGKLLVVGQVALSTLLLVATGMLVRSTQRLEHADLGVARDQLVTARVDATRGGYEGERLKAFIDDLQQRLTRVRGASGVAFSENGIFGGTESQTTLRVESYIARADSDTVVAMDDVSAGYFRATGAHVLRGREFMASDGAGAPKVAIVNESMARFFFPTSDAIGHHVTVDSATYEIVGIVGDVRGQSVREPAGRRLYLPLLQLPRTPGQVYFQVRTAGDPTRLVEPVRRALQAADASVPVLDVDTLNELVRDSVSQDRLVARVVSLFGVLALVLASLGLYGVIAYATLRRTGEFGLRMALGADRGTVTRLVLRDALGLVAAGAVVGVPAAIAATRLLRAQLFEVGTLDLPSIGVAAGVLLVSAAVAAYVPALRASRVAPLEALRTE